MLRALFTWVCVVGVAGCGILDASDEDRTRDLQEARAAWERAAIQDYDLDMRRLCFCGTPIDVTVRVRGGQRFDVLYELDGAPAPVPPQFALYYPTVPELFERIERAFREEADEVRVTYHPTLGYPTELWVDQSRSISDEEEGFEVELLLPVDS
jgi:hypothetical protein